MKEVTGGVTQFDSNMAGITLPSTTKVAIAFSSTGAAGSVSGGAVLNKSGTLPTGLTMLRLGQNGNGSNHLNGNISAFKYYPKALPDTQIQLMTQ